MVRMPMRMSAALYGLIVVFLAVAGVAWSAASKPDEPAKLALLIGNKNYVPTVGPLKNPHENIAIIEAALKKLGFKVTVLKDTDYRAMDIGLRRYAFEARRAGSGAISFFYYSGHAVANPQSQVNYLIPVSVQNTDDESLWRHSIPLLTIIDTLGRQAPDAQHYLVLDAARSEFNLSGNAQKGLAPVADMPNMLIAYATAPAIAAPASGSEPSAFAKALAEEVVKPDIEAVAMFRNVQARVKQTAGQAPFLSSPPLPPVYFSESPVHRQQEEEKRAAEAAKPPSGNEPKAGESFRDCSNCPEMVVVPAGSFIMGSPDDEPERSKGEDPQHKVTFARPFAVGKFTVTFAEWDACVAAGGCGAYRPSDEGWGRGDMPVINVGWDDAQAYAKWLSKTTGKKYRLLSEAEWEYMARAGTTTPFWWGSAISPDQADYNGEGILYAGGGSKGEYRRKTVPVRSFKPNPWGIYQVHGNVWEWVEDCWNRNYDGAPADGSARTTGDCGAYIVRGGAWTMGPRDLRSANRIYYYAQNRFEDIGFRVARTLD